MVSNDFESLTDLELWVQKRLDELLRTNQVSSISCKLLANLMQSNTTTAASTYVEHPEDILLMLLLLFKARA